MLTLCINTVRVKHVDSLRIRISYFICSHIRSNKIKPRLEKMWTRDQVCYRKLTEGTSSKKSLVAG
jgi:hypothetical protein